MNQQKYNQPINLQTHQQARESGVGIGNITNSIGHFFHDHIGKILGILLLCAAVFLALKIRNNMAGGDLMAGVINMLVELLR